MGRQSLIHIHSNVYNDGPKSPSASSLNYGELAINYNSSEPAIFLKDSENNVVKFNAVTRNEIETINSAITETSGAISTIYELIEEDERVTAAALNELNTIKQNVITDLSTIRENASSGKSAYNTISGYGDVVTHNASEFATAEQGAKSDTAIQSGNNISLLTNDAGYITSGDVEDKEDKVNKVTSLNSGSTDEQYPSAKAVYDVIISNERVTAAALNEMNNGKQNVISDLSSIRENAASGKTAYDTISGYGDVVSHNASEFATATQGTKADTAMQSGSNVSLLINDTGYLTSGDVETKEDKTNKVTSLNSGNTDTQYPSAKSVFDVIASNERVTATALNTLNANKQNVISDLSTIRENALSGKSAFDTILGYGNIVTHDASEFATASQGTKADTAIQSGNNISLLVNDANYITSADVTTKEDKANKVTSLDSGCTDTQYPSAKVVYDTITDNEEVVSLALNELNTGKINEPSSEGTNGQVLSTDGNGGRIWVNQSGGITLATSITSNGVTLTLQQWIDRISSITIDE